MNTLEAKRLVERMQVFWPTIFKGRDEFFGEVYRKFKTVDVHAGHQAVETLINTKKVGVPSYAEIIECLPGRTAQENNCTKCSGTGWISTDYVYGATEVVRDCSCTQRQQPEYKSSTPKLSKKVETF